MCETERLIENKSIVDHSLLAGVLKEYYKNKTESIILASSDSDFWVLISSLREARYLVLNEYKKTSVTIIEKLNKNNIKHCYMNDFAQDGIQKFKADVLYYGLVERIEKFNKNGCFETLDVNELVRDIFYAAEIESEGAQLQKEKDNFINKYLKNGFVIKPVMENGKYHLKMDIPKKL